MKKLRIYLPFVLLALTILIFAGCNSVIPSPGATEDVGTISGQIKLPVLCACDLSGEVPGGVGDCDETESWAIIANAVVELKSAQRGSCRRILDTTITDEDGNYQFEDVKPGLYIITAYCADPETHKTDNNLLVKDVAQKLEGIGLDAGIPDCTSTALALVIEKINNCYNDWYRCFGKLTNSRIYNLVEKIAKDVNKVDIPAIMAHIDFGEYCDDRFEDLVDLICEWNCCTPSPGATGGGGGGGGGGGDDEDPSSPALKVTKTAVQETYSEIDEVINYNITVKNTGNVTLTNIVVTDPGADAGSITGSPIAILAPDEEATVTAKHTVTQKDLDNGSYKNIATAIGEDPQGNEVKDEDDETVNGDQNRSIDFEKSADRDTYSKAGEIITYIYKVKNTGNVTLTGVKVEELPGFTGKGDIPKPEFEGIFDGNDPVTGGEEGTLQPGHTAVYKAKYTVVEEDLKQKSIYNKAQGSADDVKPKEDDETVDKKADPEPKATLIVEKVVGPSPIAVPSFEFTVTGPNDYKEKFKLPYKDDQNKDVYIIGLTDLVAGGYTITEEDPGNGWSTTVQVGKEDPIDGRTGKAQLASGKTVKVIFTNTYTGGTQPKAKLTVKKLVDPATTTAQSFDFAITGKSFSDKFTLNDGETKPFELDPGEYTIEEKVPNGWSVKTIAVKGGDGDIDSNKVTIKVEGEQDITVIFTNMQQIKSIDFEKSADRDFYSREGEIVTYTYKVTNTGNVALTGVKVTELPGYFTGHGEAPVPVFRYTENPVDGSEGTLKPGQTAVYEAEYTIVDDDLYMDELYNYAQGSADGVAPVAGHATVYLDTDPTGCTKETAWGGNYKGPGKGAWWYYYDTKGPRTQKIYAGQKETDGTVQYVDGKIIIDLGTMKLQEGTETVKVQGYRILPDKKPVPGHFEHKGTELEIPVGSYRYYAIHLDVEVCH